MYRQLGSYLWLWLCLLRMLSGAPAAATALSDCEEFLRQDPLAEEPIQCLGELASDPKLREQVREILETQADGGVQNPALYRLLGDQRVRTNYLDTGPELAIAAYARSVEQYLAGGDIASAFQAKVKAIQMRRQYWSQEDIREEKEEVEAMIQDAETFVGEHGLETDWLLFERLSLGWKLGEDYGHIYRRLELARESLLSDASPKDRYRFHSFAAELALELGRFDTARVEAERMLVESPEGRPASEANARLALGRALAGTGLPGGSYPKAARAELAKGLAAARESEYLVAKLSHALAQIEPEQRRVPLLEECLAESTPDTLERAWCAADLGLLLPEGSGRSQSLITEYIEILLRADDPWLGIFTSDLLLELSLRRWPGNASAVAEGLLESVEAIRESQQRGLDQAHILHTWAEPFAVVAGRLLERAHQGDPEARAGAFRIGEWLRARVLSEALGGAGRASASSSEQAAMAELGRREALLRLQALLAEIEGDREALSRARSGLTKAAEERQDQGIDDQEAGGLGRQEFAKIEDVRAALAADEAMLSFQLAAERRLNGRFAGGSWLVVDTQEESRVYPLPDLETFGPKLQDILASVSPARDPAGLWETLYADLLEAAMEDLPPRVRRLILLPDGLLHLLPFAALRPRGEGPLAERFLVTAEASATLWLERRGSDRGQSPPAALVLANPWLDSRQAGESWQVDEDSGVREDSGVSEDSRGGENGLRQWAIEQVEALGPLPFAEKEGRVIRRHLGQGSVLFSGVAATEESLAREDLGRFSILHLATHAVVDEGSGSGSGVLLAVGDGGEDGVLEPSEIARLPLSGQLVVLAACRSAAGEILRGEGVMSLARSFFEGGARTVIGSLRPLSDVEALSFFEGFYANLADGQSVGQAFHGVQRERIAAGAPLGAWSHLVLLGDADWVPIPGGARLSLAEKWNPGRRGLWALALLLVALGGLLLWRDRR